LIVLSILVTCSHSICGQEPEEGTKRTIEAPSPDGQFAFRYAGESDSEKQTYDLIDKASGKVLMIVAESDPDLGPSARFNMEVLWRPDSKAQFSLGLDTIPVTASTQLSFDTSFVLNADDLRRLAISFATCIGPPEFEVECSDGITRSFDSVEAVANYDNPVSKQIQAIRIRAFSENMKEQVSLAMTAGGPHSTFFLSLEGSEEHVRELKEAIDDRVAGMKPWYSWLTRISFMSIGFFGCLAAYVALLLLIAFGMLRGNSPPKSAPQDARSIAIAILVVLGALGVALGGGWLLDRLRNIAFPEATFAIGQGEERFRHQERVRWVVLVGFIVSLAAGFVPIFLFR
jgi:hypothetical protein